MSPFAPASPQALPINSFPFKKHTVRATTIEGKPWFVARDVCEALTIPWRGNTLSSIKNEWKGVRSFRMFQRNQSLKVISEPAVYKLAFRSNKPEADEFTNWVASEVLPAIRKTGGYQAQTPPQLPLVKALDKSYSNTLGGLSRARSAIFLALLDTKERKPFVVLAKAFCDLAFLSDEAINRARA